MLNARAKDECIGFTVLSNIFHVQVERTVVSVNSIYHDTYVGAYTVLDISIARWLYVCLSVCALIRAVWR